MNSTLEFKSPLVSTSVIIAEEGIPPVYPTNGIKNVTGALLAVPTGVDVVMSEEDGDGGFEVGLVVGFEVGSAVGFEVGLVVGFEVGLVVGRDVGFAVGMDVGDTVIPLSPKVKVKRTSQ